MESKEKILRSKKLIITIILGISLGLLFGSIGTPNESEVSEAKIKVASVKTEVEERNNLLASRKSELDELKIKENNLKIKKDQILEDERVAQKKADDERLAKEEDAKKKQASQNQEAQERKSSNYASSGEKPQGEMVWKTATGTKYHRTNNCGNTNSSNATQVTIGTAQSQGLSPCKKCF
ncbi:hypothetical protein ACQPU1_02300 [Clostridium paraputrificum]|uniref:hypothetical protein n=1 Tax=Clostridium paraputrificum TaxID=29363 RepID=UPI003D33D60C